jgi:tRNA(fMet)-specific endonuclease VapC
LTRPGLLLLDTNILIHLVRKSPVGLFIESQFRLQMRRERPVVSIVTIGEALAIARRSNWGPAKIEVLEHLFQGLVTVQISDEILELYAQLDVLLRRSGKAVEQNDIWIAATTVATGAHLLTTDKDFDPLYPAYLDRTWIDPQRPDA